MLCVATYNLHFGGDGREKQIIEVLRSINADVMVLTEASKPKVVEILANALNMQSVIAPGRKTSIAALSRLPIKNWNSFYPSHIGRPLLEVGLQTLSGQSITLFGLHLQCHFFKHNEQQRVHQLKTYLDYIQTRNCSSHIVLGDFNAVAHADQPRLDRMPLKEKLMLWWERGQIYHDAIQTIINRGYSDCFRTVNPTDDGFTLPVNAPNIRLDYIFADSEVAQQLKTCCVVTDPALSLTASDHFPIFAQFEL
jgi:endonuclease/exonuclease/phosphatase family metal-dependent hydrolase